MKILWITNNLLPRIKEELGIKDNYTCGWMPALAEALKTYCPDIHLGIATVYSGQTMINRTIDGVDYYCLPVGHGCLNKRMEQWGNNWKMVRDSFRPDVIHIHGTEYPYGLAWIKSCGSEHVVVSIQGLVSIIDRYRLAGITETQWNKSRPFIQKIIGDKAFSILMREGDRGRPGETIRCRQEREYISSVSHVIGRTTWDRIHTTTIHPGIQYHCGDEILRDDFLKADPWTPQSKDAPRIFVIGRNTPIKGVHLAIMGMKLVIQKYPNATLRIAGNIRLPSNFLRQRCYLNFLNKTLDQTGIRDHVQFLGPLNAKEIINELHHANVFLCPSAIENSPNSLCEALLIGVPSVASYAGGIPDYVHHGVNGFLYRYEEYEMMASYICELIGNKALCEKFSKKAREESIIRHDPRTITKTMYSIYQIVGKK